MQKRELFVGKLPRGIEISDFRAMFEKYGKLTRCDIKTSSSNGKFGFIAFEEVDNGEEAIKALHDTEVQGSKITVEWAKSKDRGRGERSRRHSPRYSPYSGRRRRSSRSPSPRRRDRRGRSPRRDSRRDRSRSPRGRSDRYRRYRSRSPSPRSRDDRSRRSRSPVASRRRSRSPIDKRADSPRKTENNDGTDRSEQKNTAALSPSKSEE